MIRRPPRSTQSRSSAASDVYKRQEGLHAMLSVPLIWHGMVVGVLNVQAIKRRRFRPREIAFLQTIAALLAGIVEKGRLTAEVEARLVQLTALDAARAELLSVVTHE